VTKILVPKIMIIILEDNI